MKGNFLANELQPVLPPDAKEAGEREMTIAELAQALGKLTTNSAPENDGLTSTGYKQFWDS